MGSDDSFSTVGSLVEYRLFGWRLYPNYFGAHSLASLLVLDFEQTPPLRILTRGMKALRLFFIRRPVEF